MSDDPFRTSGYLDECVDLLDTPIWKLALMRLNGWPRLPAPATAQAWRPWHRWYGRRDGLSLHPPWRNFG